MGHPTLKGTGEMVTSIEKRAKPRAGSEHGPDAAHTALSGRKVKASFNLTEGDLGMLREIAQRQGGSVTQALRTAIATEKWLYDQVDRKARLLVEEPNGDKRELVFTQLYR